MVLGFGSKRKKPAPEPTVLRTSPSLPELTQQRIPWPEDLVDLDAVYAASYPSPPSDDHSTFNGPAKTSFQGTRGPVPFHKPFNYGMVTPGDNIITPKPNSIAALFGSGVPPPPSSYNGLSPRGRTGSGARTRRAKNAPTFNLMFSGAKRTGKTSLIRLLLDTSTISPTNTAEQLKSLLEYRSSPSCPTRDTTTVSVEILQTAPNRTPSPEDRIVLTCIDTPGFDFAESKEFALEQAVSDVVKYVDLQFAESMGEESKVVRTSKTDRHVHLCIYLIDPESVMTPAARQAKSRLASNGFASPRQGDVPRFSEYDSEEDEDDVVEGNSAQQTDQSVSDDSDYEPPTPISPPDDKTPRNSVDARPQPKKTNLSPPQDSESQPQSDSVHPDSDPVEKHRLGMSPAEIRVIARLAKRVNVLPIIARSDTLTNGKLERIKRAVRRDLQAVQDVDIWGIWDAEPGVTQGQSFAAKDNNTPSSSAHNEIQNEENDDDERQSRPVIKLRTQNRGLARSRSRKSLKAAFGAEYDEPEIAASPGYPVSPSASSEPVGDDRDDISRRTSVASTKGGTDTVGYSVSSSYGAVFSRADLRVRMPFAVIAPEREGRKSTIAKGGGASGNRNGHHTPTAQTYNVYGMRFVREFRWGTIDVLDPHHCDFAALRAAILGSYMRTLKVVTKDVLYERFRTEKLLARRATANISEAERKRIIDNLSF